MIELNGIKKHYTLNGKDVAILKGISLFIGKGEFVSIMGPSGSGKSTLSAILGCLSTPSEGSYRINGSEVTSFDSDTLARLRNESIGFILIAISSIFILILISGGNDYIGIKRCLFIFIAGFTLFIRGKKQSKE